MAHISTPARVLLLPLGLSACDLLAPPVCTTEAVPSITVDVRDAATHAPAAAGANGYAREGSFRVDLLVPDRALDALTMYGPFERPGTYSVVVEKAGYQRWTKENVRVRKGECHVETARLQADLQPEP